MIKPILCHSVIGICIAILLSLPACSIPAQLGANPSAPMPTATWSPTATHTAPAESPQKVMLGSLISPTPTSAMPATIPYTSSSLADLSESAWQTQPLSATGTTDATPTPELQRPSPSATATATATPNPPTATPMPTSTPAAAPDTPPGYIHNGSNIRYEPRVALETLIGQACPGDQVIILEQSVEWVRVYITKQAADCVPERVAVGTAGWVSRENVTVLDYTPATLAQWQAIPSGLPSVLVEEAVNGDTISVTKNDSTNRVRLLGIDAPNLGAEQGTSTECFAREAAANVHDVAGGQMVLLQADPSAGEENAAGHLLRYVWFPDGRMLNRDLILQGYAFATTDEIRYTNQEVFEQAETIARTEQRGLWSPDTCNGVRETSDDTPISREPIVPQRPPADLDTNGDGIVTCEDFLSQNDAKRGLDAGYTELDTNNDGIPCEYLPPAIVPAPLPPTQPTQPTITPLLSSPTVAPTSQPMWEIP